MLEQTFALIGLLHMVGAFKFLTLTGSDIQQLQSGVVLLTDGSRGFQIFGAAIYMIALIALLLRYGDVIALVMRNKALVIFVVFILISALWSELPTVTMRRSAALVGTTIFATYLAVRIKPSEFITLLAISLGFVAAESLLLVFLLPEFAVHTRSNIGAWGGALGQKNIFGRTMVLSMLVLWAVLPQTRSYKPLVWALFFLSIFLVVMSQSRTSWIVATGLMLSLPFLRYLRGARVPMTMRLVVVAIIGLGGVGYLVLQFADDGLALLGRDATFSGRTDIWASAINVGLKSPILGSGYRTFYTSGLTNQVQIGNGHNSFLDIWLELGSVGLVLFFASLVVAVSRALNRLTNSDDRRGLFFVMYMIFMMVFGMAAQVFPDHGTIPWVVYVTVILYLTPMAPVTQPGRAIVRHEVPVPAE
jgi:O-antigen ligase